VRSVDVEVTIDEVRCRPGLLVSPRREDPTAPTDASEAGGAHQTGHTLAADADIAVAKRTVNTRRSVGAVRFGVNRFNRLGQVCILSGSLGRSSSPPRIIPAGGDAQHAAHGSDRKLGLVRTYETEDRSGIESVSRANQAVAF